MFEEILQIRETIISFFKRYEMIILFVLKFFAGVVIFSVINHIGFPIEELKMISAPPLALPFILLMAILFAVVPVTVAYGMIVVNIGIQISASIGIMAFVVLFLLCVLFFYVRLAPKESILILATVFAFYFKVPYLVPIIAGLYFSLASIMPITLGIFIWSFAPVIHSLLAALDKTTQFSIMEIPGKIAEIYSSISSSIMADEQWIFTSFIFAMVVVVVYFVGRLSIDYSKDLAIGLGAVLTIISFIIAALVVSVEMSIIGMIFFTLLSALIAEAIKFFDIVLDYQRAERVQFEDDKNYYYVKVIPKVILTKRKRVVKRIRPSQYDQ